MQKVRLANGERAALRASKNEHGAESRKAKVIGHILLADPIYYLIIVSHLKGKNAAIPEGEEIVAYIQGDVVLDPSKFQAANPTMAGNDARLAEKDKQVSQP